MMTPSSSSPAPGASGGGGISNSLGGLANGPMGGGSPMGGASQPMQIQRNFFNPPSLPRPPQQQQPGMAAGMQLGGTGTAPATEAGLQQLANKVAREALLRTGSGGARVVDLGEPEDDGVTLSGLYKAAQVLQYLARAGRGVAAGGGQKEAQAGLRPGLARMGKIPTRPLYTKYAMVPAAPPPPPITQPPPQAPAGAAPPGAPPGAAPPMGGAPMPAQPGMPPPGAPPGAAPPAGGAMPPAPMGAPPGAPPGPPPPPPVVDPSTGMPVPPPADPNQMAAQGMNPASLQATPRLTQQRPRDSQDAQQEANFLGAMEAAKPGPAEEQRMLQDRANIEKTSWWAAGLKTSFAKLAQLGMGGGMGGGMGKGMGGGMMGQGRGGIAAPSPQGLGGMQIPGAAIGMGQGRGGIAAPSPQGPGGVAAPRPQGPGGMRVGSGQGPGTVPAPAPQGPGTVPVQMPRILKQGPGSVPAQMPQGRGTVPVLGQGRGGIPAPLPQGQGGIGVNGGQGLGGAVSPSPQGLGGGRIVTAADSLYFGLGVASALAGRR